MKEQIETIKARIDILDLCREYGLDLKKNGKNYQCLCPLHPEQNPSFTIDEEKQLFHCFGCRIGGDVFTLVMEKEQISFPEAIRKLGEIAGIKLPDAINDDFCQQQMIIDEIFNSALTLFHLNLGLQLNPDSQSALRYLEQRGVERTSIGRFIIGYAPKADMLMHFLKNICGYQTEDILKAGIVKQDSIGNIYPFFRDRIIFPFLRNGKAFYFTGRALKDSNQPKYLHLPTSEFVKKDIYNIDALRSDKDIHITEGIFDCILAEQDGFRSIALCGFQHLKDHQIKKLKEKQPYLAFDNDENDAGQKAALKLAEQLFTEGIDSKIITIQRRAKKLKVDLADYLSYEGKEAFNELKENSLNFIDYKIEELLGFSQDKQRKLIKREMFPLLFRLDETDSASYLEKIKEKCKFKTEVSKALTKDFRKARKEYQQKEALRQTEKKKIPEITMEEKEEAIEYLKHPNIIQNIQNDFRMIGIVGEDANALSIYLFSLTRKTSEPISAVLFGDSSAGKSYVLNKIAELVPDEDVMIISSASPKAFEYGEEDQLKHKFIIIQEIEGMADVEPVIRLMQSEGKLARYVPICEYDGGPFKSVCREVECPASIITTTTRDRVHPENSTRIFELYLDQSQEQTERIHELNKEKATINGKTKEKEITKVRNLHKNIQRVIKPIPVDMPYSKLIDFPFSSTRNRRDLPRFLKLIEAVSLLRQYQKELKKTDEGTDYIEADIEDYKVSYCLGKKLLASTLSPISERTRDLMKAILDLEGDEFARIDVTRKAKEMKIQISTNRGTQKAQYESLEDQGAIECLGREAGGYKYRKKITSLDELDDISMSVIPTPEELWRKIQQEEKEIDEIF